MIFKAVLIISHLMGTNVGIVDITPMPDMETCEQLRTVILRSTENDWKPIKKDYVKCEEL